MNVNEYNTPRDYLNHLDQLINNSLLLAAQYKNKNGPPELIINLTNHAMDIMINKVIYLEKLSIICQFQPYKEQGTSILSMSQKPPLTLKRSLSETNLKSQKKINHAAKKITASTLYS